MNKKDFQKTIREADKKAMGMELNDFKKAVLDRIGAIEGEMFYVRQLVGTDYGAVKRSRSLLAKIKKDAAHDKVVWARQDREWAKIDKKLEKTA